MIKPLKRKKKAKTSLKQFKLIPSDLTACQNKIQGHLKEYRKIQCPINTKSPMSCTQSNILRHAKKQDYKIHKHKKKKKSKATDLGMTDRKEFAVEDIKPAIIHSPYALDEGKI